MKIVLDLHSSGSVCYEVKVFASATCVETHRCNSKQSAIQYMNQELKSTHYKDLHFSVKCVDDQCIQYIDYL